MSDIRYRVTPELLKQIADNRYTERKLLAKHKPADPEEEELDDAGILYLRPPSDAWILPLIEALKTNTHIKELTIAYPEISDTCLMALCSLPIEKLNISHTDLEGSSGNFIGLIELIKNMTSLKELDLRSCRLSDKVLEAIAISKIEDILTGSAWSPRKPPRARI